VTGVSDELHTKFLDLCEVLHVSPLATSALVDLLYEAFYEGHDKAMLSVARNRKQ
jgi:hypothetical protein